MNSTDITPDLLIQTGLGIIILLLLFKLTPLYFQKLKTRRRLKKGLVKEKEAYKRLTQLGYKIIGNNIKHNYSLQANQENINIGLEIDYLVKKKGKTYIIEVKSGESATQITNSNTRRQILEYSLFIKNDGVFLLDMEKEELQEIVFPIKHKNTPKKSPILAFIILGITLIFLLLSYFRIIEFDTKNLDHLLVPETNQDSQ